MPRRSRSATGWRRRWAGDERFGGRAFITPFSPDYGGEELLKQPPKPFLRAKPASDQGPCDDLPDHVAAMLRQLAYDRRGCRGRRAVVDADWWAITASHFS